MGVASGNFLGTVNDIDYYRHTDSSYVVVYGVNFSFCIIEREKTVNLRSSHALNNADEEPFPFDRLEEIIATINLLS